MQWKDMTPWTAVCFLAARQYVLHCSEELRARRWSSFLRVTSEMSVAQAILQGRLPQPQHKLIVIFCPSGGLCQFALLWWMSVMGHPPKGNSAFTVHLLHSHLEENEVLNNELAWSSYINGRLATRKIQGWPPKMCWKTPIAPFTAMMPHTIITARILS